MNSENISKDENLKKIKSRVVLENLKSDFIFKKIVNTLKKNKSLEIIKYNKKFQKKLNLNINDYKEYSLIEIELKVEENKYGKFINITDKLKEYFHIYFENSNVETKKKIISKKMIK